MKNSAALSRVVAVVSLEHNKEKMLCLHNAMIWFFFFPTYSWIHFKVRLVEVGDGGAVHPLQAAIAGRSTTASATMVLKSQPGVAFAIGAPD